MSPLKVRLTACDDQIFLGPSHVIHDAIKQIDQNQKGIVLITDTDQRLIGTISDGDIRRAILAGKPLDTRLESLLSEKTCQVGSPYTRPVTVRVGTPAAEMLRLMQEHAVRQLPVLDNDDHVVDLVMADELGLDNQAPLQAVIMAGGAGTRLRPLTTDMPKPMLPVGDRPAMELVVQRLHQAGIRQINVTTHYLPEKIKDHFGDGTAFGVQLTYVNEETPLGTAGALSLLGEWGEEPLLVVNGDILTNMNYKSVLRYHREHGASLTLAVRKYDVPVPYGVVECEHGLVGQIREKPVFSFFVNAGIYLLEPDVRSYIPHGQRLDMPELIRQLLNDGKHVAAFPVLEYWMDIGQLVDYEQAQRDLQEGKIAA